MKFILGQKIKMSQIFEGNEVVPVTLVKAGPCFVAQVKSKDKDGYSAVQIGFGLAKHPKKPQQGHLQKIKNQTFVKNSKYLREFKTENLELKEGDEIKVDTFKEGEKVKISGISKGRGFTGVVKRHGFAGGPKSHGQKHQHRAPGSIGTSFPERVLKGKRMAGRSGSQQVTLKSQIVKIDKDSDLLALRGAVPGRQGTLFKIWTVE